MNMHAVVREAGVVGVRQRALPSLGPLDVLVRVRAAGICRTDLQVARGELGAVDPIVLGHELSGEVVATGTNAEFPRGLPVSAIPWQEDSWLGIDRDGAFATHVVLHRDQVLPLPPMPWTHGAYVEPVAAALGADVAPQARSAVVLGTGRIAELTARVLRLRGTDVVVTDEADGADADLVVEARPLPTVLHRALDAVRPGGTIVLKSRADATLELPLQRAIAREVTIRAVGHGSFTRAVDLLSGGQLFIDDLLGPSFPIEDWAEAFAAGEGQKVFLVPS
jgi:L-iditol 2-dehydrogenase